MSRVLVVDQWVSSLRWRSAARCHGVIGRSNDRVNVRSGGTLALSSKREQNWWARLLIASLATMAMLLSSGCGNGKQFRLGEASRNDVSGQKIASIGGKPISSFRGNDDADAGGERQDSESSSILASKSDKTNSSDRRGNASSKSSPSSNKTNGNEIRGRVIDSANQPIPGAQVRLVASDDNLSADTTTDEEGWFKFSKLPSSQKFELIAEYDNQTATRYVYAPDPRVRLQFSREIDLNSASIRDQDLPETNADVNPSRRSSRQAGYDDPSSKTDDEQLLDLKSSKEEKSNQPVGRYQDDELNDKDDGQDPYTPAGAGTGNSPSRRIKKSSSSSDAAPPIKAPATWKSQPKWSSEGHASTIGPQDHWGVASSEQLDSGSWSRIDYKSSLTSGRAKSKQATRDDVQLASNASPGSLLASEPSQPEWRRSPQNGQPNVLVDKVSEPETKGNAYSSDPKPRGQRWEDMEWPTATTKPTKSNLDKDATKAEVQVAKSNNQYATASCDFDEASTRLRDFQLPDLTGNPLSFKDLGSDYILLDFWGTWCGQSRTTIPRLNELQKKYGGQLQVVGVAYETDNAGGPAELADAARLVAAAKEQYGINYSLVLGQHGSCPLESQLHVTRFPTLILLDRNGRVLWRDMGANPAMFDRLERVLTGYTEKRRSRSN